MDYGFFCVLPPILTIVLALITKNVFIALFLGIFFSHFIFFNWHPILALDGTLQALIRVFEDNDNTIIIIVCMLLGGLIFVIEHSGGIAGFVKLMTSQKGLIKSKRGANLFTWILGLFIFTSGTLSTLVVGSVSRPINDALKVPHEKSAFIVHTTSTPVCVLIPLSGWGASMMGYLQSAGISTDDSAKILVQSIPLNFYCLIAVFSVLFFAFSGKDFGLMKKAEQRALTTGQLDDPASNPITEPVDTEVLTIGKPLARNLLIPIATLIATIIVVLLVTGQGNPIDGNGMKAILWGVFVALFIAGALYVSQKTFSFQEYLGLVFKGSGDMLSIGAILMFAFAMGSMVKELGTGLYMAEMFKSFLNPAVLPALIFIMAALISFSTGTSLGTMAITMVIAIPMANTLDVNIPLTAAAVFGGSIFGDHTSPISDTTIMTCSTTGCNVIDHVRSQLPYALTFAAITVVIYLIFGFFL